MKEKILKHDELYLVLNREGMPLNICKNLLEGQLAWRSHMNPAAIRSHRPLGLFKAKLTDLKRVSGWSSPKYKLSVESTFKRATKEFERAAGRE